jgi:hypothetical protein
MNGLVCAATLVLGLSTGADPVLPAPVPVPMPGRSIPDLPPGIGFYRPNPYDQWQYYAPDRFGRWRPRVLMVPGTDDGFRLIDGKPAVAPFAHPNSWMPYAD